MTLQPPVAPETADNAARPAVPAASAPATSVTPEPALAPAPAPAGGPEVATDVPPPAPDEPLLTPPVAPGPAAAPAQAAIAPDPLPETPPLPQTTPPAPDAAPDLPLARPLPGPEPQPPTQPPTQSQPRPDPQIESAGLLQPVKPIIEPQAPRQLTPDSGLPGAEGVRVGQLPRILADPPIAEPGTEAALPPADGPPVQRFARAFENPEARPLFSILLLDTGETGLDRAALAQISFPLTFVIDPLQPGAADAAEVYRRGGHEVLMLASGIPEGATPGDLEQTFQTLERVLPEAVGVMDRPGAGFQGNRPLAAQVVPILQEAGRGLVTFDVGLNAADQEARRAALPAAMIFRRLDAEGEETPVIRRYLDRAAFKAAQEGQVVVLGETRAETVAAVLEWAVEGRAASVALAPVTAVMGLP